MRKILAHAVIFCFSTRRTQKQPDAIIQPMKFLAYTAAAVALATTARAEGPDFKKDIAPILEASCVKCHNSTKAKGKLNMETKEGAMKGGKETKLIVTGKPDESSLIKSISLPEDDDNAMPPKDKGTRVTKEQAELLKKWIEAGAAWPDDAKLTVPAK